MKQKLPDKAFVAFVCLVGKPLLPTPVRIVVGIVPAFARGYGGQARASPELPPSRNQPSREATARREAPARPAFVKLRHGKQDGVAGRSVPTHYGKSCCWFGRNCAGAAYRRRDA
jgi:hypothetical protein